MTPLPALIFGFVLGVRHATDADHVAIGLAMAYRLGVREGLFAATPAGLPE